MNMKITKKHSMLGIFMLLLSSMLIGSSLAAEGDYAISITLNQSTQSSSSSKLNMADASGDINLILSNATQGVSMLYDAPISFLGSPIPKWELEFSSSSTSQSAINDAGDRMVVVLDDTEKVVCYSDASSTVPLWTYDAVDLFSFGHFSIDNMGSYITFTDRQVGSDKIICLNGKDGTKLWEHDMTSGIYEYGLDISGNGARTFVSQSNDTLMCFNTATGDLTWSTNISLYGDVVVSDDASTVTVRSSIPRGVSVLDGGTGNLLSTIEIEDYYLGYVAITEDGSHFILPTYTYGDPGASLLYFSRESNIPVWDVDHQGSYYSDISTDGSLAAIGGRFGNFLLVDCGDGSIITNHSFGLAWLNVQITDDGTLAVAYESYEDIIVAYKIEAVSGTSVDDFDSSNILGQIINTFTTRSNWAGLGVAAILGLVLGAILFRSKKAKSSPKPSPKSKPKSAPKRKR